MKLLQHGENIFDVCPNHQLSYLLSETTSALRKFLNDKLDNLGLEGRLSDLSEPGMITTSVAPVSHGHLVSVKSMCIDT